MVRLIDSTTLLAMLSSRNRILNKNIVLKKPELAKRLVFCGPLDMMTRAQLKLLGQYLINLKISDDDNEGDIFLSWLVFVQKLQITIYDLPHKTLQLL